MIFRYIIALTFVTTLTLAQTVPWSDMGCYETTYSLNNSSILLYNSPDSVFSHYRNRYGTVPNYIWWSDVQGNININFSIQYNFPSEIYYIDEPTWSSATLTWGDIKPYVSLITTQVESSDTTSTPVIWGDDTSSVYLGTKGSWMGGFTINSTQIPITNWTNPWKIWIELETDDPPLVCERDGMVLIDTLVIMKTSRNTYMDTLIWAQTDWDSNGTIELAERLLGIYPNNTSLMRTLLPYYYENANCDSVSRIGTHYIDVMRNNLDPFRISYSYPGPSPTISEVERMIQYLCVDGVVKPWRDPSRGF